MRRIKIVLCVAAALVFFLVGCAAQTEVSKQESAAAATEKWTVLLYLCGSDLESAGSAATDTINDLLGAAPTENARFVVQTGGAKRWHTDGIKKDRIGRYEINNGKLSLIEELPQANMGAENTLADFLRFGTENYAAEKMAVFFWDHGGGSVAGVCSDQNYNGDTLSLIEMRSAFAAAQAQFDLVGFDACLMSTAETALHLKDYARYMVASQEIEPTGGWDYRAIAQSVYAGEATSGAAFGKTICDSYAKKYQGEKRSKTLTLSVVDLKKAQEISAATDAMAEDLSKRFDTKFGLPEVVSAARSAEQYGGSADTEGYSNMVDLGAFAQHWYGEENNAVTNAIKAAIVYQTRGELRKEGMGLSFYYPLKYTDQKLRAYQTVSVSDGYADFLGRAYQHIPEGVIRFSDAGSAQSQSEFGITIAKESLPYVSSVQYYLLEMHEGEQSYETIVYGLGRGVDLKNDANTGQYSGTLLNGWPAIDGAMLFAVPIEQADEYTIFSSPVLLNGKKASLRYAKSAVDGGYEILGVWGGVSAQTGTAEKKLSPLQDGDRLTVMYQQKSEIGQSASLLEGETITVTPKTAISGRALDMDYYQYAFVITDLFGNKYFSNSAVFEQDTGGRYSIIAVSQDVEKEAYIS